MAPPRVTLPPLVAADSSPAPKSLEPPLPVVTLTRSHLVSSLFHAILNARLSKVKLLLDNGASVVTKTDHGQNLLVVALYVPDHNNRRKMFRYLLRRGADCCEVDPATGRDVLSWACYLGRLAQVRDILSAGAGDINLLHRDHSGKIALHHATIGGHDAIVRILLDAMYKYRLSVDVPDKEGLTPFIHAKRCGYFDIAQLLLQKGYGASSHQFDSQTYRSADAWAEIGLRERRQLARRDRNRQVARYKLRVQLPPSEVSHQQRPPSRRREVFAGAGESKDGVRVLDVHPENHSHASNGRSSTDGELAIERTADRNEWSCGNAVGRRFKYNYAMSPSHSTRDTLPTLTNKSLDTAFTLWTLTHGASESQPTRFVGSQLDSSKAGQSGQQADHLAGMMAVLADQQTASFRKVARPPTTRPSVPAQKLKPQRARVSTLAVLLGRDRQHRKKQGRDNRQKKPRQPRSKKQPV